MSHLLLRWSYLRAIRLAVIVNAGLAGSASAHIKWFSAYDVAEKPRALEHVLSSDYQFLIGISLLMLMLGCLIEWTEMGSPLVRALDRATRVLEENTELIFRVGCVFFFVAIWAIGGIILTPELTTSSTAIGVLQLGIAAGMVARRTMPLSGLGIAVLFGFALWDYGAFHLADYPIFIGVAAYIALTGMQKDFFGARPIDVVRWTAGITLMWASVEKWAYPGWSFPLFIEHPNLTFGFEPEFFMRAAGAVEFSLAFALMWTPLVRRVAAILLITMFISAVFEFGKMDLIGHTLIVVVLLGIVGDSGGKSVLTRYPWLLPVGYAGALSAFLTTYYLVHAALFGTPIT